MVVHVTNFINTNGMLMVSFVMSGKQQWTICLDLEFSVASRYEQVLLCKCKQRKEWDLLTVYTTGGMQTSGMRQKWMH